MPNEQDKCNCGEEQSVCLHIMPVCRCAKWHIKAAWKDARGARLPRKRLSERGPGGRSLQDGDLHETRRQPGPRARVHLRGERERRAGGLTGAGSRGGGGGEGEGVEARGEEGGVAEAPAEVRRGGARAGVGDDAHDLARGERGGGVEVAVEHLQPVQAHAHARGQVRGRLAARGAEEVADPENLVGEQHVVRVQQVRVEAPHAHPVQPEGRPDLLQLLLRAQREPAPLHAHRHARAPHLSPHGGAGGGAGPLGLGGEEADPLLHAAEGEAGSPAEAAAPHGAAAVGGGLGGKHRDRGAGRQRGRVGAHAKRLGAVGGASLDEQVGGAAHGQVDGAHGAARGEGGVGAQDAQLRRRGRQHLEPQALRRRRRVGHGHRARGQRHRHERAVGVARQVHRLEAQRHVAHVPRARRPRRVHGPLGLRVGAVPARDGVDGGEAHRRGGRPDGEAHRGEVVAVHRRHLQLHARAGHRLYPAGGGDQRQAAARERRHGGAAAQVDHGAGGVQRAAARLRQPGAHAAAQQQRRCEVVARAVVALIQLVVARRRQRRREQRAHPGRAPRGRHHLDNEVHGHRPRQPRQPRSHRHLVEARGRGEERDEAVVDGGGGLRVVDAGLR
mmetsp:Transcript_58625/g.155007  ORF Transcript_58625/g.155007 Transcript_58625/m.155007 type:complete len:615 (-) Transcript_58625:1836-3680(-)